MKKIIFQRALAVLAVAVFFLSAPCPVAAQQGGTTRYVYDDNGRLRAVIAPTGEATIYEYDAAGNFTAIRRATADVLEIFSFSPAEGISGDLVTFIGIGFTGGVNTVSFNGANGRIVEVTGSSVVAEVPEGATTGPVTITTPGASATTSQPFVLRGVRLRPLSSRLLFGESLQFTVQVETAAEDRSVAWSVNGITGGSAAVGTISNTGLYTAPAKETTVVIRATSNADISMSGEAQVVVRNPSNLNALFASVSVRKGLSNGSTVIAPATSIRYGLAEGSLAATGKSVSVRYGLAGVTSAQSTGVSVQHGSADNAAAVSLPVSVHNGHSSGVDSTLSASVSATTGPHITAVAPHRIARNSTVTLTITGVNLSGANTLFFITESGAIETALSVSNFTVSEDGTTLTASLSVGSGVALGRRVVVVSTTTGDSLTVNTSLNTIEVVSQ